MLAASGLTAEEDEGEPDSDCWRSAEEAALPLPSFGERWGLASGLRSDARTCATVQCVTQLYGAM